MNHSLNDWLVMSLIYLPLKNLNLPEFDELGVYSFSDGVAVDGVVGGLKIPFEFAASLFVGENFKSVTGAGPPFASFPSIAVMHVAFTISPFVIRIAHIIFNSFKMIFKHAGPGSF